MPDRIDADEVADHLRGRYGIVTAPGQGPLRGAILRLGHLGHVAAADVVTGLAALAAALEDLGRAPAGGDAVAAAVAVYRAAGAWPR
jgi:aspartate aminotransferase-like enzyme